MQTPFYVMFYVMSCPSLACVLQVTSLAPAAGQVMLCPSLAEVQGSTFDTPVVLLSQGLSGIEDIPPGVAAVLTQAGVDVLSHVAIRARSQGVLLASCADAHAWQQLVDLEVRPLLSPCGGHGVRTGSRSVCCPQRRVVRRNCCIACAGCFMWWPCS